ncbi:MAG: IclR family transcriptional regulator [Pseudomonadota bacterium]
MPEDGAPSAAASRGDRGSAIQRALALLEAVVASERPLSLAQLADSLALPKATVHRLANRLEEEGMLARDPATRHFTMGPRLNRLAVDTLTAAARRAPRHAVLEALARETSETCNLGMLDGNRVVYLDRVESQWPLRLELSVGSHVPLHCTAMGKLFLAHMPKRSRERLYDAAPLERFTERTIVDRERLEQEITAIRRDRVSVNDQEYMVGLVGMAVPVGTAKNAGGFTATLAIHAPEPRLNATEIRKHLPALNDAADRLGRLLGETA